jgi:hypothetical protein
MERDLNGCLLFIFFSSPCIRLRSDCLPSLRPSSPSVLSSLSLRVWRPSQSLSNPDCFPSIRLWSDGLPSLRLQSDGLPDLRLPLGTAFQVSIYGPGVRPSPFPILTAYQVSGSGLTAFQVSASSLTAFQTFGSPPAGLAGLPLRVWRPSQSLSNPDRFPSIRPRSDGLPTWIPWLSIHYERVKNFFYYVIKTIDI